MPNPGALKQFTLQCGQRVKLRTNVRDQNVKTPSNGFLQHLFGVHPNWCFVSVCVVKQIKLAQTPVCFNTNTGNIFFVVKLVFPNKSNGKVKKKHFFETNNLHWSCFI